MPHILPFSIFHLFHFFPLYIYIASGLFSRGLIFTEVTKRMVYHVLPLVPMDFNWCKTLNISYLLFDIHCQWLHHYSGSVYNQGRLNTCNAVRLPVGPILIFARQCRRSHWSKCLTNFDNSLNNFSNQPNICGN